MYAERYNISIVTDASGDAIGYSPIITGRIINVIYKKTDFADGVDFAITLEQTGQGVWTESNVNSTKSVAPRQATTDVIGVASLYAAAGEPVEDYIVAVKDRLKIVISSGGNAKCGNFILVIA